MSTKVQTPLQYHDAFNRFDVLDDAVTALEGTLDLMTKLIDHDPALNADAAVTLERHLKRDFLALAEVCAETRKAILTPLADGEGGDHAE